MHDFVSAASPVLAGHSQGAYPGAFAVQHAEDGNWATKVARGWMLSCWRGQCQRVEETPRAIENHRVAEETRARGLSGVL